MGETRVDLLHLLEDLRDAYTVSLEETILTEIVANSLDSGARRIELATDASSATLTIVDDGCGMKRAELRRYHDVAASTKTRGQGIGFAGVGIKLALLICERVYTESRRGKVHVATRWHLANRHRAPWNWVSAEGLVAERGTAVQLKLTNALSPLLDTGFLEASLRRHYLPLFDSSFQPLLREHYPHGVQMIVNGGPLESARRAVRQEARLEIRIGRKRKPSALGYLLRDSLPLAEDERGIAISTLGKVIRRGWDWLGITPATPDLIGGVIEFPALAECLTLNKADFIRSGPRGMTYLGCRKALQEAISRQLGEWGDSRDVAAETRRRAARPVERDLERVLIELADDYPLIGTLVERRAGGQRRLPIGERAVIAESRGLVATALALSQQEKNGESPPARTALGEGEEALEDEGMSGPPEKPSSESAPFGSGISLPGSQGPRRPGRYGLTIQFETRTDSHDLARLVESTIWVNDSHPAFRRAVASRSEGYHLALAVAMALAPLAIEPAQQHPFVNAFLVLWGGAVENGNRGNRTRVR